MRKLLLITLCVLTYATTYAQNITTIAGGFGDGIPAINAPLNYPCGSAVDRSGNIYIVDQLNHRIRKVTASTGVISTVAGNGITGYSGDDSIATSAKLSNPSGVTLDSSGNIYIADYGNNRVRKVTASTGNITTLVGNGIPAYGGDGSAATLASLYNPSGVAVDGAGNIFIADQGSHRIRKVTAFTGIISTVAGNGTRTYWGDGNSATSASLNNPWGVAVDDSGNIYIADQGNHRIRKVTVSTGIISTIAGNGTAGYGGDGSAANSANLNKPTGLALDGSGNIYIADNNNHRVRKISSSTGIINTVVGVGTVGFEGDGSASTSANLYFPIGVTLDGSGNIYIADGNNFRIRKVTATTGIISTLAGNGTLRYGGDGNIATLANLYYPQDVAVDGSGNIYIADELNNRIRKVTKSTRVISTVAGGGSLGDGNSAISANLNGPRGLAVDGSGNIYIADLGNNRIRKVNAFTGIISTVAGNGISGYSGDGSLATSAKLSGPTGVTLDGSGNIYIADNGNHRIRKVTVSTGIISTVAGNGGTGAYGGDGSAATLANLNYPSRVVVDSLGNIYIADRVNHRIRKVTASTGIISTVAGNGTFGYSGDGSLATSAKLNFPYGLVLDGTGNIYIADVNNERIRKVTASNGIISTVAGNGIYGYEGDGSAATSANLFGPTGVAVDDLGNIYIVDGGNHRIRKVIVSIDNNYLYNSQTICAGTVPVILTGSTPIGATGSYTYTWLSSSNSATAGFTAIPFTNTINYSPGVLTQNKWFRRYVVSGNYTDTSAAVAIILSTAIGNDSITSMAQTICSGSIPASITATIATGGNGNTYNYKWLKSTTSVTTGFVDAGGNDTTQNFTSNAITKNTWFKRSVISGVCNADTTNAILVTVKPTSTSTNNISICASLLPYTWNGLTFNTAGTQTKTGLTNAVGCDSSATLTLTIKSTSISTNNVSICPSALPYSWNGLTFNAAGTQTKTGLTNSVGCDSSATLNLTVKTTSTSTNNISVCSSALPYTWNSRTYNSNRTDTIYLTNSVGCDSITILKLTVNPSPATSSISGKATAARIDTASYSVNGLSGSVFNWSVSGATIQSGAGSNKIQVKWSTTGTQLVNVTETSNQGCIGTQKTLSVIVSPTIGMNELKQNNQVIIYPNPFSETIHITLLNNLKLEKAIIYDLVGNEIISSTKNEIDASSLKSGLYLIMIVDNYGNSYSQKLVKN